MNLRRLLGVIRLYPLLSLLLLSANANVEKTIFLAPEAAALPHEQFTRALASLAHPAGAWSTDLQTSLPVAFPTEAHPRGLDSWFLLRGLNPGQRYEVRVCWAAIQPTNYEIDTFSIAHALETPGLSSSLARFLANDEPLSTSAHQVDVHGSFESSLLLRIQAAADFYAQNATLMRHPPPVDVDLILDPYLLSAFPQSLIPTAGYISVLAVGSFYLSGVILKGLVARPNAKQRVD